MSTSKTLYVQFLILLFQMSDSGILFDSGKSSQQTAAPLKSPTEIRSVHFPLIDLSTETTNSNSSYEQSSTLISIQNIGLSNAVTSNSIIKSVRSI
jgi:hypothetical protein